MKNQDKNITLTRAIACLFVIGIHWASFLQNIPVNQPRGSLSLFLFSIFFFSTNLFFMISGVFLFNPDKVFHPKQIAHNFFKIALPLFYFGNIFYFYELCVYGSVPYRYIQSFTVSGHPTWYFIHVLPIFTVAPFLKIPKIEGLKHNLLALLGISFLFFITEAGKVSPFNNALYNFHMGLSYMITGHILKNISQFEKVKIYRNWFLLFYIMLIAVIWQLQIREILKTSNLIARGGIYYNNSSIFIYLQTVLAFLFLQTLPTFDANNIFYKIMSFISRYSLRIFGWHVIALWWLSPLVTWYIPGPLKWPLLYIIVVLASLFISIIDTFLWVFIQSKINKFFKLFKQREA